MGNVAIKLFKNDNTNKGIGINVADDTASIGYNLYVNGTTNISGALSASSLSLTTALPVDQGGTGATTQADARTALGAAAESHTHSYAGSSSVGGAATSANVLNVIDERNAAMTIDKSNKLEAFFSNNGMPDSKWWAGIHVTGWNGAYSSWELVGPAHNTDQRTQPLYIRSSNTNSAWGSWRQVYDSSNPPTAAAVGAAASSHTHTYANITDAGTHVYDATVSRTKNTVLAAPNGSAGTASFRALVAADIPSLSASKITSDTFDAARIPTISITDKTSGTLTVARGGTGSTTASGARSNLGITTTSLYSGGLSSGSTTISSADGYKFFIIGGYVYTDSSNNKYGHTNVCVSKNALSSTARQYIISDDVANHYIRFSVTLSSGTLTISILAIAGSGAQINEVYGVN